MGWFSGVLRWLSFGRLGAGAAEPAGGLLCFGVEAADVLQFGVATADALAYSAATSDVLAFGVETEDC